MRRTGHLFEEVVAFPNLLRAARRAARGKHSRPAVARFLADLEPELFVLQGELVEGSWRPGRFHTFHIRDPKPRVISAAPFADRVVHHALIGVLDPVLDRCQIPASFACRVGKGTHRAVRLAQRCARRWPFFLKGDVEAFFETVDHGILKELLRRKVKDRRVLGLLDRIIAGPDGGGGAGRGLPIGNLTSQYFANHYLSPFDHFVKQELGVKGYLRYMDDFLLFAGSKEELYLQRARIRGFLRDALGLQLKERLSFVAPVSAGIPFLGFAVFPGTVRLRGAVARRMRRRIRKRVREHRRGELDAGRLAASVGASAAHAAHAATRGLRRRWFFGDA